MRAPDYFSVETYWVIRKKVEAYWDFAVKLTTQSYGIH